MAQSDVNLPTIPLPRLRRARQLLALLELLRELDALLDFGSRVDVSGIQFTNTSAVNKTFAKARELLRSDTDATR